MNPVKLDSLYNFKLHQCDLALVVCRAWKESDPSHQAIIGAISLKIARKLLLVYLFVHKFIWEPGAFYHPAGPDLLFLPLLFQGLVVHVYQHTYTRTCGVAHLVCACVYTLRHSVGSGLRFTHKFYRMSSQLCVDVTVRLGTRPGNSSLARKIRVSGTKMAYSILENSIQVILLT